MVDFEFLDSIVGDGERADRNWLLRWAMSEAGCESRDNDAEWCWGTAGGVLCKVAVDKDVACHGIKEDHLEKGHVSAADPEQLRECMVHDTRAGGERRVGARIP